MALYGLSTYFLIRWVGTAPDFSSCDVALPSGQFDMCLKTATDRANAERSSYQTPTIGAAVGATFAVGVAIYHGAGLGLGGSW